MAGAQPARMVRPAPHAQLAVKALKDPTLFNFLGLGAEAHERDIENALIRHITQPYAPI